jgi:hypothetical protein
MEDQWEWGGKRAMRVNMTEAIQCMYGNNNEHMVNSGNGRVRK